MKSFFLITLFFCYTTTFSQSKTDTITILYNSAWQEIKTGVPAFVGAVWKEGNKWHKQDYYFPELTLKTDGIYSDKDLKVKDGLFTWYHSNGMMEDSCLYISQQREGTQITWDEKGNQTSLLHWHKNIPVDTAAWWNNERITAFQITDSAGNGLYKSLLPDGKMPRVSGTLMNGKRAGKWTFKDDLGIPGMDAVYLADSVISVVCYNEKGEVETGKKDCQIEKPAAFKGGNDGWRRYLEHNLRYPEEAVNNQISGVVRVQFNIQKDGSVSDIKVMESPAESLTREGFRLIKNSPKWEPAIQYNRRVIYRHIQSITFAMQ